MTTISAGVALLLVAATMTGACARHDDADNVTTTTEVVTDETATNAGEGNGFTTDSLDNATDTHAAAPANAT